MSEKNIDLDKFIKSYEDIASSVINDKVNYPEENDLDAVLNYDPIASVEGLYNKNIGDILNSAGVNKSMVLLGHAFKHNKHKSNLLEKLGDTVYSDKVERYLLIITSIGFEKVLELDFYSNISESNEKFYVFWCDGMLLVFDTFRSNVNGGNMYFNWKSNGESIFPDRVSGCWNIKDKTGEVPFDVLYPNCLKTTDPEVLERERLWNEKWKRESIFSGYIDCREAFCHQINKLKMNGTILPKWEFVPFLWLLHHEDTKVPKKINKERIAMLPEHVRNAITPEE